MWRDHYPLWPERLTPMRRLPYRPPGLTVNTPNPRYAGHIRTVGLTFRGSVPGPNAERDARICVVVRLGQSHESVAREHGISRVRVT